MKLSRKKGDSKDLVRSSWGDGCYFFCCFLIPVLSAILAIVADILYFQIALLVLQAVDLVFVFILIFVLNRRVVYAEDQEAVLRRARHVQVTTKNFESLTKFGNMPVPDFQLIKTYFFAETGEIVKVKFCYTCKKFKPPLAVHCSKCRECCLRFDHHCSWLKTCIGRENYRLFIAFLVGLLIEGVLIFLTAIYGWKEEAEYRLVGRILLGIAYFGAAVITGFVFLLLMFHLFLTLKGKSTYQYIKGRFREKIYDETAAKVKSGDLVNMAEEQVIPPAGDENK